MAFDSFLNRMNLNTFLFPFYFTSCHAVMVITYTNSIMLHS